ncbi:hypothetical protein PG996_011453 [Apiospora saccharicola]|uniref:Uncharacterized protein n=1 Tax=Apiospora saccharicola TaxID=335842 RepID=A0ABR1UHD2_9PEZI
MGRKMFLELVRDRGGEASDRPEDAEDAEGLVRLRRLSGPSRSWSPRNCGCEGPGAPTIRSIFGQ